MTVAELQARMGFREFFDWCEYLHQLEVEDSERIGDSWYQHAILMAKIDAACGVKRPDPRKYLPRPRKRASKRTLADIRAHFMSAAATSRGESDGRLIDGG